MMEFKLDNNIIKVTKNESKESLEFQLHAFGETQLILKETKAFAIDVDSMAECTHLTKYFGPYSITKTTEDRFVFSKNNESVLLSKHGW